MSLDSVDDVEAAEDMAAMLARVVRGLLFAPVSTSDVDQARSALEEWGDYCRPTCGFRTEGECQDDEDTCGCPCGHEPREEVT